MKHRNELVLCNNSEKEQIIGEKRRAEERPVTFFLNRQKHGKVVACPKLVKKFAEKVSNSKENSCFFLIIM